MKISRRKALNNIMAASAMAILPNWAVGRDLGLSILIKNGSVFTGKSLEKLYIGIDFEGKIKLLKTPNTAKKVIDASGKIISSGFIDILGDNSSNPENTYQIFEKYKLTDGVTTVLQMHGGAGNPSEYYETFRKVPHYTNFGVSTKIMLIRSLPSLSQRYKSVENALLAGALGVSHSLEYQPTPYAEVLAYAKIAKKFERPFFLHLRYSSKEKELEGVKEAIKIAKESGARVHIDHLHSTGGTFQMQKALELIAKARLEGLEITTCVYPYTFWATYLHSKRFDEGWREMYQLDYQDLTIVGTGEKLTQQRFNALRKQMGVLVAVPEGTMPAEKTIDLALKTDFCMIASDGGIEKEPLANSHPRGAGCFATALQYAKKMGLSWQEILPKMTTLPAQLLRPSLQERGVIKEHNLADLTIFDPQTIQGKATVKNPNQFSQGIDCVILNGKIVYQDQKILLKAGKAIKWD